MKFLIVSVVWLWLLLFFLGLLMMYGSFAFQFMSEWFYTYKVVA